MLDYTKYRSDMERLGVLDIMDEPSFNRAYGIETEFKPLHITPKKSEQKPDRDPLPYRTYTTITLAKLKEIAEAAYMRGYNDAKDEA